MITKLSIYFRVYAYCTTSIHALPIISCTVVLYETMKSLYSSYLLGVLHDRFFLNLLFFSLLPVSTKFMLFTL